jgi:hypothetical protein
MVSTSSARVVAYSWAGRGRAEARDTRCGPLQVAPCIEASGNTKMERFIALAFYLALIVVGFYFDIWIYRPGYGFSVLVEGTFLILFGGYLVWLDFLSPDREKL